MFHRSSHKVVVLVVAGVLPLLIPAVGAAATCTWTGGGGDALWSTTANWSGCAGPGIPQNGDDLVFPAGAARPANENDIAALSLTSIAINGTGAGDARYSISGLGVTLTTAAGLLFNSLSDSGGQGPSFLAPITLGANLTIANTGAGPGNATVAAIDTDGFVLSFDPSTANIAATGAIGGAGDVVKNGNGLLILQAANTYMGQTSLTAGTTNLRHNNALGSNLQDTTVEAGATLELRGVTVPEPLVVDGGTIQFTTVAPPGVTKSRLSGTILLTADSVFESTFASHLIVTGAVTGEFALTLRGPGTLRLESTANTFGNRFSPLTIESGTLSTSNNNIGDDVLVVLGDDATWYPDYGEYIGNIAGSGYVSLRYTGHVIINGGYPSEFSGAWGGWQEGPFFGKFTIATELTLGPGGSTGFTTYLSGTLHMNTPSTSWLTLTGGVLDLNGATRTVDRLWGAGLIELGSSTLRVNGGDYSGVIRDQGAGGGFVKNGNATLIFSPGINLAYSGPTVVENGPLWVNATIPQKALLLTGGRLGGVGVVGAVTATGAAIHPGPDANLNQAGILRTGNLQLSPTSNVTIDLGREYVSQQIVHDRLIVTGTVNLASASLALVKLAEQIPTVTAPASAIIIDNDGADPVAGTFAGAPEGAILAVTTVGARTLSYQISYVGGDGNDVVLTRLPLLTCTWTGVLSPANASWGHLENWTGCGGTRIWSGDAALFPAGAGNPTHSTFSSELAWIAIEGVGAGDARYDISGQAITLTSAAGLRFSAPDDASGAGPRFVAPLLLGASAAITNDGSGSGAASVGAIDTSTFTLTLNAATAPIDVSGIIAGTGGVVKNGAAPVFFTAANTYAGATEINAGILVVNGAQPQSAMVIVGGVLSGTGTVGAITLDTGDINPGPIASGASIGTLRSGSVTMSATSTFAVDLNGETHDRLAVTGTVTLNGTELLTAGVLSPGFGAILIENDGDDPIAGTFKNLPEGGTVDIDSASYRISYVGGDGNDVVLTRLEFLTYLLAEGATGTFFDYDLLIANPNLAAAPITLTFFTREGQTIVEQRTVAAQSRLTLNVDTIPGLEQTEASVRVVSEDGLPLAVERTMFWDATSYGGHTAEAVRGASLQWYFAEGAQGFFQTYLLAVNPGDAPADLTFTFLRESEAPLVTTLTVAANGRLTLYAGDFPELVDRSFGVSVLATRPVVVERAMYFGSAPGRFWLGGTGSIGVPEPATHWSFAEGATGSFFDTYLLLANPSAAPIDATVTFLSGTGQTHAVTRTVPAQGRLTLGLDEELTGQLPPGAVASVIDSPQPLIAERSMYWPGDTSPWGEAHNSFGMTASGLHWGVAEGRLGGSRQMSTFILLANSEATAADVTVTFLRETGAPITRTYTVPPNSRFNVDVAADAPELNDSSFGADIRVTNDVPITVERSLYWNANGVFWAGGANAPATRLP